MDNKAGRKEIIYQMTMTEARKMLDQDLITKEEYTEFDTKMRQKYAPVVGNLFAEIDLT